VVAREGIYAALKEVLDPEYPVNLVDLGLIRGVKVDGGRVQVQLTYTSIGCPCWDIIQDDIRTRLLREPGVEQVDIEVVYEPWSLADVTPEGRAALRRLGVV